MKTVTTLPVVCWMILEIFVSAGFGDVLVTHNGTQYVGKVEDQGNSYILTKSDGSVMTLTKSMVAKAILHDELKKEFDRRCCDTDFADEVKVSALIQWCRANGLESDADACEMRANTAKFTAEFAKAGSDPVRLAQLARWCWRRALNAEGDRAEAKALALGANNDAVQRELEFGVEDYLSSEPQGGDANAWVARWKGNLSLLFLWQGMSLLAVQFVNDSPCRIEVPTSAFADLKLAGTGKPGSEMPAGSVWTVPRYNRVLLAREPGLNPRPPTPPAAGDSGARYGNFTMQEWRLCDLLVYRTHAKPGNSKAKPTRLSVWAHQVTLRGKRVDFYYWFVTGATDRMESRTGSSTSFRK